MALAIAKIHTPPRPSTLLHRPRLLSYLTNQTNRQLVVISAPAGYGKTSLLLDFAHASSVPVAWYALDEFDNSPHVFVRYLVESIRVHEPTFGAEAISTLMTATDTFESLRPVVLSIANDLYCLPRSMIIALDDYHTIRNELIGRLIALLIQHTGEQAHIFISSRTVPYIPDQVLLLARGQLSGLSTGDLKFNAQEIQGLLQQNFAVMVPEPQASTLAQYCDGWVTALLLLGHQAGWAELAVGALGTPADPKRVYDYLAEQVFERLSSELQHFMLGSSVLDHMSPEQLDSLPGLTQSGIYLGMLAQQQLFVSRLGGNQETYSYHPLFRSFLRERLQAQHHRWHEQLSLSAAETYVRAEQWEKAIDIYLSLGRKQEAIRALESAEVSLRTTQQILGMAPWLERLPDSESQIRPHLISIQAKTHFVRGELERAIDQFDLAANMFRTAGDRVSAADKLILKASALRGLARYHECIEDCNVITGLLSGAPNVNSYTALNLSNRGLSFFELGRLQAALEDFIEASKLLLDSPDLASRATSAQCLGMAERALGRPAEAVRHYREALDLWKAAGRPLEAANTLNSLGNIYYLRGEFDAAEAVLHDALRRARATKALRTEAIVLCTLGDVHKDQREYFKALELFGDGLRKAHDAHYVYASTYCQMATGDIYRLLGDFTRAEEWLEGAADHIKSSGSKTSIAQLQLSRAKLYRDQGRLDEALRLVMDAAELFREAGDRHFEALCEFLWGQALDLSGAKEEAAKHLTRTAELIQALGYEQFVVVEGAQAITTLQRAATLPGVGALYKKVLERVRPSAPMQSTPTVSLDRSSILTVYTLGQERYLTGAAEVMQLRPQVRDLFLFLLMRYPQGARPDELWELAWPDLAKDRADSILHMTITRIRKSLCPVELVNDWYILRPDQIWYDAREFERTLIDATRARTTRTRISNLLHALDLYRGEYVPRLDKDWAVLERQRLAKSRAAAMISLGRIYYEAEEFESALQIYQRLNIEEPFLEEAWQGAVQTLARMGNRAAALAYFEKYESVLREGMDIEPSPEASALRRRILNMDA